jgi:hypothetical protein
MRLHKYVAIRTATNEVVLCNFLPQKPTSLQTVMELLHRGTQGVIRTLDDI